MVVAIRTNDYIMDKQEVRTDYSWLQSDICNDFFHPNICHVCKKINDDNLISCNDCYMIFYCNAQHREEHFKKHQMFCIYITQYLNQNVGANWRFLISHTESKWFQSRNKFLLKITQQYPRILQPYEKQMIIYAKSCYICHQQINLESCKRCYSTYLCATHKTPDTNKPFICHDVLKCSKLLLSLNLDILNTFPVDYIVELPQFYESKIKYSNNMESFISTFIRPIYNDTHYQNMLAHTKVIWTSFEYFYSDYISGPLTLYNGMRKANLLDKIGTSQCVIHVISASVVEKRYIGSWEFLLHAFRELRELTIVLVGEEMETELLHLTVCKECQHLNKTLSIECDSRSYPDYMNDSSSRQPNVIITFQEHVNKKTWCNCILQAPHMKCPYILMAESHTIETENVNNIYKLTNVNPVYNKPNNFKSLYPIKQLDRNNLGYRNSQVTIYWEKPPEDDEKSVEEI